MPVARSLVSANRWLRVIKTYRFPWYLTLVSANHASSNPGESGNQLTQSNKFKFSKFLLIAFNFIIVMTLVNHSLFTVSELFGFYFV